MQSVSQCNSLYCIGPHLFIDDGLISVSSGLTRTTHMPVKRTDPVLRRGASWHLQPQWFMRVARGAGNPGSALLPFASAVAARHDAAVPLSHMRRRMCTGGGIGYVHT